MPTFNVFKNRTLKLLLALDMGMEKVDTEALNLISLRCLKVIVFSMLLHLSISDTSMK